MRRLLVAIALIAVACDTPSRRAIFVCQPHAASEESACATKILSKMARLAYRRPVTKDDTQSLLEFFKTGRQEGGTFDAGIQFALERLLVDPDFLLRVYRDPVKAASQKTSTCRLGTTPSTCTFRQTSAIS